VIKKIVENIQRVIIGKEEVIENIMVALLARGHILLEDVPGVGKTTIAKALAKSLNCSFSRIQFTPDLLPSDILGVSIYNSKEGNFIFRKGPIHNQVILADEINRASPKTQSSLLEVMQENQVTIDGFTYIMKDPFIVIATQNPIEFEGTFPLPEAQLDRFMIKASIGYPSKEKELEIIRSNRNDSRLEELEPVIEASEIIRLRKEADNVFVKEEIQEYITDIIRETRINDKILLGCSPRATIALYKGVKAYALIKGRSYVTPEDVKRMAVSILSHRIILKPETRYKGISSEAIIMDILDKARLPLVKNYE